MCEDDMLLFDTGDHYNTEYHPDDRSCTLHLSCFPDIELTDSTSVHPTLLSTISMWATTQSP